MPRPPAALVARSGTGRARRLDPAVSQALLLGVVLAAFLGLGVVWLWQFRRGQPLDIDEAGYLAIAINDSRGLLDGGVSGFWEAFLAPSIQAPLMTTLTAPLFAVVGPGILTGQLVPLALGGVMILAAYGLGREVGGSRLGWVTLALTAGSPVVIGYARMYNFAIASGATVAIMLWAIARSRNFERPMWSTVAGLAIGLAALSRTMVLAFLPCLVVVGAVTVIVGPRRGPRMANLALAAVSALVVAGPWYVRNGHRVLDYLTSFGYGRNSTSYGKDESMLTLSSWRDTASYLLGSTFVPMAVLWAAGFVGVVVTLVARCRHHGLSHTLMTAVRSRLLPSVAWLLWGLAALTSSGNKGTGFLVPLVPAFAVLAAWTVWQLPRPVAQAAVALVAAVAAFNTSITMFSTASWAQQQTVTLPWVGSAPWSDGRGVFQTYLASARPGLQMGQPSRGQARALHRSTEMLTHELDQVGPGQVFIVFGFRHGLVNPNTVQLAQLLDGGPMLSLTMIDPVAVPNDLGAMGRYLTTGEAAGACLLVTARGTAMEIEPRVDGDLMARAAREAGFVRRTTVGLPDGRTVVVWRRSATCPVT